ncbi:hypothetical protein P12x_001661 [Tundrisphaera lichenicola]|uniref:hypothetical protein n=1 Tax=Tundrisphaera lichenicola TaxID=2029860 RepID=UPI003EBD5CE1
MSPMTVWNGRANRWFRIVLGAFLIGGFLVLIGVPYLRWTSDPSLFDDDFLRVGSLRRASLSEALFRPFNEHMAPLFELVSWLCWEGSGRDVLALPRAFLVSSFLAFGSSVVLLVNLIRRETKSFPAAMFGVVFYSLSSVAAEVVLWYSASSFTWAATSTLTAWYAARSAVESVSPEARRGWLVGSMIASAIAPAFSAIGVLAGPLASLRLLSQSGISRFRLLLLSMLPTIGTGLYWLVCSRFRYGELVSTSLGRNLDVEAALWATIRAPSLVLIPGLVGLPGQAGRFPDWLAAGLTLIGLASCLAWAARSRNRPLILGGLALILGGYFAVYATRARSGDLSVFMVQRYHLFPQLGIVVLIAAGSSWGLSRFAGKPLVGIASATALAGLLAFLHYPRMQSTAEWSFRFPDQPPRLEAAMRLEAKCSREGITMAQAMKALEPIRPRWAPQPWPFNPLLHLFGKGPELARLADEMVRPTLLASMSAEDREALFGGMEATRYRVGSSLWGERPTVSSARFVGSYRMGILGEGRYKAQGWPCHLDFTLESEASNALAISLPGLKARRPLEIWWSGRDEDWSPCRSVRWEPTSDSPGVDWAVPLDRLPHWRAGEVHRLRLVFRESGLVSVGLPRLIR